MGVRTPVPTPPSVRVCSASYRGPLCASDSRLDPGPIFRLNTGMMRRASMTTATAGGDEAVSDDEPRPRRPAARRGAFVADARVVDARADAGQQRRQQGEDHGHAHQRDQHAREPHAAQGRHGDDEQREQADRDGDARRHHGATGRLHGDDDGILVAASVCAFLAPTRHQDQRVVDRHAEPDQGDEELDDDADVAERRQSEHEHERGQDGHRGDQQREQREERREHEEQHEERTRCGRAASRAGHSSSPGHRRRDSRP